MVLEIQERIRVAAYLLWEDRGRPPGCALDCWLDAERAILPGESGVHPARTSANTITTAAHQIYRSTVNNWTPGRWP